MKKPFVVVCDDSNNGPEDVAAGRVNVTISVPISSMRCSLLDETVFCSHSDKDHQLFLEAIARAVKARSET